MEQRDALQEAARRYGVEAKKQLCKYMEEYPLDDMAHQAFLQRWRVTDSSQEDMKRHRQDLLHGNNRQDSGSWQRTFETSFLGPLDKAADGLIYEYAKLTALKTAICPYALLDMAIVIFMGTAMLGSLCRIYRLRVGPFEHDLPLCLGIGAGVFCWPGRRAF